MEYSDDWEQVLESMSDDDWKKFFDDWEKFGDKVGWRKGGEWLRYRQLTFSEKHYTAGHLPAETSAGHLPWGGRGMVWWGGGFGFIYAGK